MNPLQNKLKNIHIKLASKSPRRHELLGYIIKDFKIVTKEIKENYPPNLSINKIAPFLAELKATAYMEDCLKNEMYITADTIVCFDNQVLGKPKSHKEAVDMLDRLSGNTHTVYTGVGILYQNKIHRFCDATKVTFYPLKKDEIEHYINTNKPFDKAGSYGIQEWMGYVGIKKMEGDFFNVMGLPLHRLYREIEKLLD